MTNLTNLVRKMHVLKILGFYVFLTQLWPLAYGEFVKQSPASKEKPYASILYTAVVGGKVALPCDISSPAADDVAVLILWYREESAQPIYTLDARRGKVNQARQLVSSYLGNRAYFNMINRPAFLQLDPVRLDDAGEYRCRVDFRKARTINTVITLKVIVPPGDPLVFNKDGKQLNGIVGPYNEGETISFLCKSVGGKPRPSVTWWNEKILLDDGYTFKPHNVVDNELTIDSVRREDLLSVLTCMVSNSNVTVPGSVSITLDLNLRPERVKIKSPKRPLSVGENVKLLCSSSGSRPAAHITWWKGNQQLQQTEVTVNKVELQMSSVTFIPVISDDGKYLSCRAVNPNIPGSAIEDGWRLEVYYKPQVSLDLGTSSGITDIKEGDDVYFECHIRANPWVSQVSWHFEDKTITSNSSLGIIITNQTLVLQRLQKDYRGRFSCSARNIEGLGVSNEIFLKVKYAPRCESSQKFTYGIAKNEAVEVVCRLEANPSNITFHWRFNKSSKLSDQIQYTSEQAISRVTYIPRTKEDYGNLSCWGTNDIGIQTYPCVFTVIPVGPPSPPQNCSVVNQTQKQIAVECLESYDGGIMQQFSLYAYSVENDKLEANLTSKFPRFLLYDLPMGKLLRLFVYAFNAKGQSEAVIISASTLKPAEKLTDKGTENESVIFRPVLLVLVAIVAVLIVVAIVVVVLIKFKNIRSTKSDQTRTLPDKSQTPLWKETSDLSEIDDKGPDIIPAQTLGRLRFQDFQESDFKNAEEDEAMERSICLISPVETFFGSSSLLEGTSLRKDSYDKVSAPNEITFIHPLLLSQKCEDISRKRVQSTKAAHCFANVIEHDIGAECSRKLPKLHISEKEDEECAATCETPLMGQRQESSV